MKKVNAKRKLVWIHNDYRKAMHPRKYDYKHLVNMDGIVSISDECVYILKDEFPEFASKMYMLENITSSIALEKQASEFYPSEYKKDDFKILLFGRLHEQKGFDMAVKAAAILKSNNMKFKWYVLGDGELRKKLRRLSKRMMSVIVSFSLGTRENPYAYIKNCDLFVRSSRILGKIGCN